MVTVSDSTDIKYFLCYSIGNLDSEMKPDLGFKKKKKSGQNFMQDVSHFFGTVIQPPLFIPFFFILSPGLECPPQSTHLSKIFSRPVSSQSLSPFQNTMTFTPIKCCMVSFFQKWQDSQRGHCILSLHSHSPFFSLYIDMWTCCSTSRWKHWFFWADCRYYFWGKVANTLLQRSHWPTS